MELLMIIVVVIGLIARANKAKQAQEDARRKREAAARAAMLQGEQADSRSAQQTRIPLTPPAPTVQPTIAARKPDPRFFDTEEDDEAAQAQIRARKERERLERERWAQQEQKRRAQQQPQIRQRLVLPDDEPEGTAKPGSLTASIASTVSTTMIQPKGRRHTLESSYASGHAHAETSMTGLQNDMDCPTEPANAGKPGAAASYSFGAQRLSFDRDAVVNGILYAEILGKPKALRRRA